MADLQKMRLEHKLNTGMADLEQRRARSVELYNYEERSGRCTECGAPTSIDVHVMRDTDGTEWKDRRRSNCNC